MSDQSSTPTPDAHSAANGPAAAPTNPDNMGHRRCMIYRPRTISTACDQCRMSDVYCQAVNGPCCTSCTH
jgi:hypothetical protein